MSQRNAIPGLSRAAVNDVVDGEHVRIHDHNRPLPPPRTSPATGTTSGTPTTTVAATNVTTPPATSSTTTTTTALRIPLTAPLAPLSSSSSSFRSRPIAGVPGSVRTVQSFESAPPMPATATPVAPATRHLLTAGGPVEAATAPPRSPLGEVSLATPRPDGERIINEYVETPFKQNSNTALNGERRLDGTTLVDGVDGKRTGANDCPKKERARSRGGKNAKADGGIAGLHRPNNDITSAITGNSGRRRRGLHSVDPSTGILSNSTSGNEAAIPGIGATPRESTGSAGGGGGGTTAVTKQPVSFTKEPANALGSRSYDPAGLSIICEFCGRCRCESCREPPPLPSRWLCNDSCFCSAETVLDYASCLCCVKGLFYHCVDGSGAGGGPGSGATGPSSMDVDGAAGGSCADEPCSCTGNRILSRWACLGALTVAMPCLVCYWPLKGCVALCETCYARHASQGCRCEPGVLVGNNASARHHPIANDIGYSRDPEKRLLDPVTPEL